MRELLTPRLPTRYVGGQDPTANVKQMLFLSPLWTPVKEIMYGGAARGGKSSALLMGALQYVEVPDYAALLLRRSYKDLTLPDSLMHRAAGWLSGTDAAWRGSEYTWNFPSGAKVVFGYCNQDTDVYQYKSAAFQYIGMDELTQYTSFQYRYLFSRLSRPEEGPLSEVPLRMRSGTNPDEAGRDWVRQRFILPYQQGELPPTREFIPAQLWDNPYVDAKAYFESLAELDPITRAQLLNGDWDVTLSAGMFDRTWLTRSGYVIERWQVPDDLTWVRYWDRAATRRRSGQRGRGPDYTACALLGWSPTQRIAYLADVQRRQLSPGEIDEWMSEMAAIDGPNVSVRQEEEGGSSGKHSSWIVSGDMVEQGVDFRGDRPMANKVGRARPVSSAWYNGRFYVVHAPWNEGYFDECEAFPGGPETYDDMVDAVSGAYGCAIRNELGGPVVAKRPWDQ